MLKLKLKIYFSLSKLIVGGNVLSLYDERTNFPKKNIFTLFYPIKFKQVLFLFAVLSGGIVLSILTLLIEIGHYKMSKGYLLQH